MKVIAMIPARIGSERVKFKNLRMLGNRPLISYAINAAKQSGIFDQIYINTDFSPLNKIAEEYGIDFYLRPPQLGTSTTKSDQVIADFIEHHPCDYLFWVNPTSPLQNYQDLEIGLKKMTHENLDSLFTVVSRKIHALYQGRPLNFSSNGLFPRSQDLSPVSTMVFSYMAWKCSSFIESYKQHGYGFICGNVGYLEIDPISAIDIDEEIDFQLAEGLINSHADSKHRPPPTYHPLLNNSLDT